MNPSWQLSVRENIQLLQVGDLLSEHTNKEVLRTVDDQIEQGFYNFVVDLSAVDYINSIGLNLLILLRERTRKQGGKVVLASLSPTVVKLFEMTKLSPLFEQTDTVEAAFGVFPEQKN
ncbi:STAS domain-containing protein [Flavilitoribacter nigricans]|uniref:Anti-sigma factor antagonist n=1 Tax=Flavilitoribacter nigricans (strain ATCC 23147 / DSM 23189 / NBRC 102662 / NCIMB 1420 / SS-2) TaxID=1122177 RepID=A0A2D0N6A9_FLAN2|nr:STAS domain-containing protein [Flavilitoribacter nigricans]PHN03916.1 anti-anti-sigma factor [Flavilitoribacter nigricans DSM 23189 = NBRC 102662]